MAFFQNLLGDPVGQTAVVPFAIGVAVALVLALAGGKRFAALGIGAAFFAAYYLIHGGVPAFPPAATAQKMFYVAAAGLLLGIALDAAGAARGGGHFFAFVVPAAALAWMRWPQIAAGPGGALIATLAALFFASIVVYWRQAASARGAETDEASSAALFPAIQLLVAGLGLGGIALLGISLSLGSLAMALAAGAGGYLLASFIAHLAAGRGFGYGAIGAFGGGGVWLALAYAAVFAADAPAKIALIGVVALAFAVDFVARPLALLVAAGGAPAAARFLQPVAYGVVVAIPPAAALAYAWFALGWRMN
ncbi:MAG: hypothetical protein JNM29_18835 [Candidatus Odyssella sp.]|nr:hypothetical protein [Candidatus Odyssella sp.]